MFDTGCAAREARTRKTTLDSAAVEQTVVLAHADAAARSVPAVHAFARFRDLARHRPSESAVDAAAAALVTEIEQNPWLVRQLSHWFEHFVAVQRAAIASAVGFAGDRIDASLARWILRKALQDDAVAVQRAAIDAAVDRADEDSVRLLRHYRREGAAPALQTELDDALDYLSGL